MSLKSPLLLTCAVIALTATARSQANPAPTDTAVAPAPIFADAPRPATEKVERASSPARRVAAPSSTVSPFVLATPKPVAEDGSPARADEIDLSALRYFAAQNDLGRVSAEIRLLRAKHPDWEPPQDLFSQAGSGVDEQPLWMLLSRRDFAGLRSRMDDIRRDKPDWQPTNDLAGKLALAEAHDQLTKASDARQWGAVIDTASATPAMLTCGDVDALWRTAEALVRTGDEARAVAAYRYILANCAEAEQRLATVQKASLLVLPETLDGLIRLGRRTADGRGEFEQVRLDLVRKKIGDAISAPSAPQPTPDEIAAVAAGASSPTGQADAQLLGWYARSRQDYGGAERWFRTALANGSDAKAAEGLVLAVRDAARPSDALALAFRYAGLDPLNRKLMLEIAAATLADPKAVPLTAEQMALVKDSADGLKSADAAQAIGWHLFQASDVAGAESWFRKSAEWQPNEAAAVGLIVSARRLRHEQDSAARIKQYRSVYPHVAELEAAMRTRAPRQSARALVSARRRMDQHLVVAGAGHRQAGPSGDGWDRSADDVMKVYNAGQYDSAVALLDQRRQSHAEPRGLAVVHAWALYHKGDWEGAKQLFTNLDGGQYSRERMEGLRVIQEAYTPPRLR